MIESEIKHHDIFCSTNLLWRLFLRKKFHIKNRKLQHDWSHDFFPGAYLPTEDQRVEPFHRIWCLYEAQYLWQRQQPLQLLLDQSNAESPKGGEDMGKTTINIFKLPNHLFCFRFQTLNFCRLCLEVYGGKISCGYHLCKGVTHSSEQVKWWSKWCTVSVKKNLGVRDHEHNSIVDSSLILQIIHPLQS